MTEERYPGERQGLGLFLEELRPIVAQALGADSLLHHAIRKALAAHRLQALRHARALFNSLPRERRQALQAGMLANMEPVPKRRPPHDTGGSPRPLASIGQAAGAQAAARPALRHEIAEEGALADTLVSFGGPLPSGIAGRLREIAGLAEPEPPRKERGPLGAPCWKTAQIEPADGAARSKGGAESG